MGQTLARAAHWTRASEVGKGKLEFTPLNEAILNSIITFVESFKEKHNVEAAIVFKHPLTWISNLHINDFVGASGYVQKEDKVISTNIAEETKKPVLEMRPSGHAGKYVIDAYNFEELNTILRLAKAKISEVQLCLEANPDPLVKIFGDAFATVPDTMEDAQVLQYLDAIITHEASLLAPGKDGQVPEKTAINPRVLAGLNKTSLRLLILLHQFDLYLMQQSVKKLADQIRLTPILVENEISVLMPFIGNDRKTCILQKLKYTSDVISQFGCRTPLWRQFHGDICYLEVKPFDKPVFYITCNTAGVYIIKGPLTDGKEFDYERIGNLHKDIISLLKEQSPFFEKMINSEEFARYIDEKVTKDRDLMQKLPSDIGLTMKIPSVGSLVELGKPLPPRSGIKSKTLKLPGLDLKSSAEDITSSAVVKTKPYVVISKADEQKKKIKKMKEPSYWEKLNKLMQNQGRIISEEKIAFALEQDVSEEESSEEEETESEEDDTDLMFRMAELSSTELPSEYWQVQKLIKYVKAGNQTGTVIALIGLRDYNLTSEYSQRAIREMGGIELFINLLETDDTRCKIASLKILQEISSCVSLCRTILKLGGLQTMVRLLHEDNKQVTALAAQNIAHMAHFRQVRTLVRQYDGIQQLVKLLKVEKRRLNAPGGSEELQLEEVRSAALALWSLAISARVRLAMRHAGAIPRLATLLHTANESILIPVVGILQECLIEEHYQVAARKEGMIPDLVKNLNSSSQELVRLSAQAIFRCAEDPGIRNLVRKFNGLTPLVGMLTDEARIGNKQLLAAITGALWKCSKSEENIQILQQKGAVNILVTMLTNQPEEVLVNVVGALGECAQQPENQAEIFKAGGIKQFINLLTHTNQQLLINLCNALKNCASDMKCIGDIDHFDGVRLLWSLLKHQNQEVQAAAAAAICPCIQNIEESGEIVRSFVGGLTLLVKLLQSDSEDVLASICAAIAIICKDEENLAVLTDNGMVPLLARLTTTDNSKLQRYLAEAIARCSKWGNNRIILGTEGAVAPLVQFLHGTDPILLRHTCSALNNLSEDPANCIIMHRSKAVDLLLKLVASSQDHILQEAAASCLANIRHVGLLSDKMQGPGGVKKPFSLLYK